MKTKLLTLLVGVAALFSVAATVAPTYTAGPDTLWRVQADPTFAADGSLATCNVQSFFQATFVNTQDPNDRFTKQLGSVNIDCVKDASKTVVYNGKTYTYGEIAGAMAAASAQEWKAANQ